MILSATMVLLPQWIANKLKKTKQFHCLKNNDQKKPAYVASPTYVTVYGLQVPINKHLIWSLLSKTMDLPELIVNKQKKTIPLSSRNNDKRKLSYVTSPAYVTSPTYVTSPVYVTLPVYVTSPAYVELPAYVT